MLSPTAAIVQRHDRERFVTALFAPAARREALWTLYAFNHELARAREVASAPTLALIRLQWWREVVEGAVRRHPVATPVREMIDAGLLDPAALDRMITAREQEAEESLDGPEWMDYLRNGAGTLMAQAGRVLGAEDRMMAELCRLGAGGGAVGLLRNAAAHAALGRWSYPRSGSAETCRRAAADLLGAPRRWPGPVIAAALPATYARRRLRGIRPGPADSVAVWSAALLRRV